MPRKRQSRGRITLNTLRVAIRTLPLDDDNRQETEELAAFIDSLQPALARLPIVDQDWCFVPIPMILHCPSCRVRHIDTGEYASKHHHTHACQSCGMVWRPAIVATVGVQFLPGFKNGDNP